MIRPYGSDSLDPRIVEDASDRKALAVAAYAWSTGGGFLNWDDPTYVLNNPELRRGFAGDALAPGHGAARVVQLEQADAALGDGAR